MTDFEKRSGSKEKKRSKSSSDSGEKRHRREDSASDASWSRRFVSVESDVASMKVNLAQLSAALLSPASGSPFSGFQLPVFQGADPSTSVVAAGDGGANLQVAPLPATAPGVSGVQAPAFPGTSAAFAGDGGANLRVTPLPGSAPGASGVQAPAYPGTSAVVAGDSGANLHVAPLPGTAPVMSGVQAPAYPGTSAVVAGDGGPNRRVALLPGMAPGVSRMQTPADPGFAAELTGVGGVSLRAAPLPGMAPGVSGEQAPLGPGSSSGLAGVGGVSFQAVPFQDVTVLASGSAVAEGGEGPSGAAGSQTAARSHPLFSEEVDEVYDEGHPGEAGILEEDSAGPFRELISTVREFLGLPMPSSLVSTLQTGVERTSGTSRHGPTPLVLPRSPLAQEVRREQLERSLGTLNPASARLPLPRRWVSRAERWYTPEGDSSGAPPLNDELLHLVENRGLSVSIPWRLATQIEGVLSSLVDITSWTDQVLGAFAGLSNVDYQQGLDCLNALARANMDIMQPCELLRLRMMMLRRQSVVNTLPRTYGDRERRQLMASPVGSHLFDVPTLATVEQRELESSQRSLVTQLARGLASSGRGSSVRPRRPLSGGLRSRQLAPVTSPSGPPPSASVSGGSFRSRGFFRGRSRGRKGSR